MLTTIPDRAMNPIIEGKDSGLNVNANPAKIPINEYGKMESTYALTTGYNLEAARMIKPVLGDTPLFLVGGMRTVSHMEDVLANNHADFISMSRPFIREPFLVNKIKEDKMDRVSCLSCHRCLAAEPNELPVYCYNKSFPK